MLCTEHLPHTVSPPHSIDGVHRILVATSEGVLYVGNIDPREGGECRITKEFRLIGGDGYVPEDVPGAVAAVSTYIVHIHVHVRMHTVPEVYL